MKISNGAWAPLLAALSLCGPAHAAVRIVIGPTPIIGGEARASRDITVINDKLAFALALGTPPPYGVPRGAIVDVAPVRAGLVGHDHVVFADFIPNAWSAWPNTYQRVRILERGPAQVVIRTRRDWGKVRIETTYTLRSHSDSIAIRTTMRNDGTEVLKNLLSGMTLWPKGGFLFGVPGVKPSVASGATGALADRVVAYDRHWTVTLHAPYLDHLANESRDLFRMHTLAPGATATFTARLQVGSSCDLAPVVRADIAHFHLPPARVHGAVRTSGGRAVAHPVVVALKQGHTYAWTCGDNGAYALDLPAGDYSIYATAKNYSQSAALPLHLGAGADATFDFASLRMPGRVRFAVTDAANGAGLDARIVIRKGVKPAVEFLGRRTFFTQLERRGVADFAIAPGHYVFAVASGGGFLGPSRDASVDIAPGRTTNVKVRLPRLFDPRTRGWYSADLHHHADQAEAVTPPADLARSQLAAGLDLLFVSDHDSTVNHAALQRIADRRGVAFIPSIEFSPSWGHFNAYPLHLGEQPGIDIGTATVGQIFAAARRMGAVVVQVNHPFIPYGYFKSLEQGVAPGGFDPAFDLVEINAANFYDDDKVAHAVWAFWNAGHRYYFSAGTDTHDVWNEVSGRVRAFAHLDGKPSALAFAEAMRGGHAYVSYGPLVYPSVMFGSDLKVKPGAAFTLAFDFVSGAGFKRAGLFVRGAVGARKSLAGARGRAHAEFAASATQATWFSLVVEDRAGHKAYTDPIWVDPVRNPF